MFICFLNSSLAFRYSCGLWTLFVTLIFWISLLLRFPLIYLCILISVSLLLSSEQRYTTCVTASWLIATRFIASRFSCASHNPRHTMGHIGSPIDTNSVLSCGCYHSIWHIKFAKHFRSINTCTVRLVRPINRWINIILSSFKGKFLFLCIRLYNAYAYINPFAGTFLCVQSQYAVATQCYFSRLIRFFLGLSCVRCVYRTHMRSESVTPKRFKKRFIFRLSVHLALLLFSQE